MCIKFGDPDSQDWKGHRQLQRQSLTTHRFARSREGKATPWVLVWLEPYTGLETHSFHSRA